MMLVHRVKSTPKHDARSARQGYSARHGLVNINHARNKVEKRDPIRWSLSALLFAWPSFLEGIARIFDIGGTLNEYNRARSPQEADARALAADWSAVGNDIWEAIAEFDHDCASSASR